MEEILNRLLLQMTQSSKWHILNPSIESRNFKQKDFAKDLARILEYNKVKTATNVIVKDAGVEAYENNYVNWDKIKTPAYYNIRMDTKIKTSYFIVTVINDDKNRHLIKFKGILKNGDITSEIVWRSDRAIGIFTPILSYVNHDCRRCENLNPIMPNYCYKSINTFNTCKANIVEASFSIGYIIVKTLSKLTQDKTVIIKQSPEISDINNKDYGDSTEDKLIRVSDTRIIYQDNKSKQKRKGTPKCEHDKPACTRVLKDGREIPVKGYTVNRGKGKGTYIV